ncbi:hypothetical protein [Pseudogracilibacillus sp. SO30301A]|uniref:hypothetical protein n=1 Tax=Pseudogracilibacillus sp. SO30301A TaxID=3098291 RepID=UPI00300DFB95
MPKNFVKLHLKTKQALLLNSDAETVENTVKAARKYTGRQDGVSFIRGLHSRTK